MLYSTDVEYFHPAETFSGTSIQCAVLPNCTVVTSSGEESEIGLRGKVSVLRGTLELMQYIFTFNCFTTRMHSQLVKIGKKQSKPKCDSY